VKYFFRKIELLDLLTNTYFLSYLFFCLHHRCLLSSLFIFYPSLFIIVAFHLLSCILFLYPSFFLFLFFNRSSMDHDELHSHIHAETKSNTKENADVGLICSLNPNTTAVKHVLTFHSLFNHLLYRHLLYRHLLYRHSIIPKSTRPSLDLRSPSAVTKDQRIQSRT